MRGLETRGTGARLVLVAKMSWLWPFACFHLYVRRFNSNVLAGLQATALISPFKILSAPSRAPLSFTSTCIVLLLPVRSACRLLVNTVPAGATQLSVSL